MATRLRSADFGPAEAGLYESSVVSAFRRTGVGPAGSRTLRISMTESHEKSLCVRFRGREGTNVANCIRTKEAHPRWQLVTTTRMI